MTITTWNNRVVEKRVYIRGIRFKTLINSLYLLSHVHSKGPKQECPDYVTAGANSCFFGISHTTVWKIYCMNVTAVTSHGNYTSQERCLDVADIGKISADLFKGD